MADAKTEHFVSALAREALERTRPQDRPRFWELLEDAGTSLQRELVERALVAGRSISELHAFADSIRAMSDVDLFAACFDFDGDLGPPEAFGLRLRAEADPLDGFLLHSQAEEVTQKTELGLRPPTPAPRTRPAGPIFAPFDEAEKLSPALLPPLVVAGSEAQVERSVSRVPGKLSEQLLNDATRALGIEYREQAVDSPRFKLEEALDRAAMSLGQGLPVPVVLGEEIGVFAGYALLVQCQMHGERRAFQLHDPLTRVTTWIAEADLLGRRALPGMDRNRRRITAIALPKLKA